MPIKSFPALSIDYFRKVEELKADYIFILDKPVVSEEFWKEVEKINIPVVWIDHHEINDKDIPEFINYYNPLKNKRQTNEPVTALCYQVTNKKEDLWIAIVGCISDKFVPKVYKVFKKNYPDLAFDSKSRIKYGTTSSAFDILYNSQVGKISKLVGFGLKDTMTNVVRMMKFLRDVETPYEVLEETPKNFLMYKKFAEINNKYQKLLSKALVEEKSSKNLLFFSYGGESSMSGSLSNELSHRFPDKFIVIVYLFGARANISARGKGIRDILLKSLEDLEDASGGGHEDAVGARVKTEDLEKFRENLENLI